MKIKIITTGGTIDKVYASGKGTLNFGFSDVPAVKEMKKDSLQITEEDRQLILKACEKAKEDKILITHGSDTMIETAKFLSIIKDKAIVLTGAPQPYKFRESDAEFNIGVAIGALNTLDSGVYIAMNGRVYEWDKCEKQPNGIFADKE